MPKNTTQWPRGPARARNRTARSGVERTNHEATTPPTLLHSALSLNSGIVTLNILFISLIAKKSAFHHFHKNRKMSTFFCFLCSTSLIDSCQRMCKMKCVNSNVASTMAQKCLASTSFCTIFDSCQSKRTNGELAEKS